MQLSEAEDLKEIGMITFGSVFIFRMIKGECFR